MRKIIFIVFPNDSTNGSVVLPVSCETDLLIPSTLFLEKTAVALPPINVENLLFQREPKKMYYGPNKTPLNWKRRQPQFNLPTVKKRRKGTYHERHRLR